MPEVFLDWAVKIRVIFFGCSLLHGLGSSRPEIMIRGDAYINMNTIQKYNIGYNSQKTVAELVFSALRRLVLFTPTETFMRCKRQKG